MSDKKLSMIADVISQSTSLHTLVLNKVKLRPIQIDTILQAIIQQR